MLLFEYPKCSTCQKAKKYLESKNFNYKSRNIVIDKLNVYELDRLIQKSGKDINKFFNTCGYMVCKVIDMMETSTHTIFLGEVVEADDYSNENAMTYKYYHEYLKGSSPKNAPTYEEKSIMNTDNDNKTKKWKCSICGYIYEGDELPDDFVCPICGVGKEKFELITEE